MEENTAQPIQQSQQPVVPAPAPQQPTPTQPKIDWMPKRTFLLIALLVVITVCLLALALIQNIKSPTVTKPSATLSYAQTNLSLSEPIVATPSGYKTDVQISTKNKVTAVQLEINYDPKVLTNVDVKASSFFTAPTILLKKIDAVNGRITYALGIGLGDTAVTGKGTVATLTFSTVTGTDSAKTPINFEPKTAVTAVGYAQSVLLKSTGVLFSLTPTPTATK